MHKTYSLGCPPSKKIMTARIFGCFSREVIWIFSCPTITGNARFPLNLIPFGGPYVSDPHTAMRPIMNAKKNMVGMRHSFAHFCLLHIWSLWTLFFLAFFACVCLNHPSVINCFGNFMEFSANSVKPTAYSSFASYHCHLWRDLSGNGTN